MAYFATLQFYVTQHARSIGSIGCREALCTSGSSESQAGGRVLLFGGVITLYVLSILGLIGIGPWSGQFATCAGILGGVGGLDMLGTLHLVFCKQERERIISRIT